ncbi:MAG TPA: TetR/AcrR family transcriptional regulator, partial [Microthrixaceae bacterium]|nr:TetR/AcrR family transcriptional regulator [Microthrixaceae bacterium]
GVTKTTLDDIAREAGCSRATVYRLFPGGKGSLIQTVGEREVGRLLVELIEVLDRSDDLEELLVVAIGTAAAFIRDNEALQTVTRHEPEQLLPYLAFDRLGPLLEATSTYLGPIFARHLGRPSADEVIEWAARLVLSYTFTPSTTIDLTNDVDVRRLVTTHLIPGISRATDTVH